MVEGFFFLSSPRELFYTFSFLKIPLSCSSPDSQKMILNLLHLDKKSEKNLLGFHSIHIELIDSTLLSFLATVLSVPLNKGSTPTFTPMCSGVPAIVCPQLGFVPISIPPPTPMPTVDFIFSSGSLHQHMNMLKYF